jgi:hypothetical protein
VGSGFRTRTGNPEMIGVKILKNKYIHFIPTMDESDGKLIYIAEPFFKYRYFEKAIITMPFEFSITLEDEEEESKKNPSKIVKLTFWDLLETFSVLNTASTFIIYHDKELDEIAKQLEGYLNQLWGSSEESILDSIYISRQIYHWMKERLELVKNKNLYEECMNYHKRMGIVGIDENDEVQKPFFERALLMRRKEQLERKKIRAVISGIEDKLEKDAYSKAEQLWEQLNGEGRILYYPPNEFPIF